MATRKKPAPKLAPDLAALAAAIRRRRKKKPRGRPFPKGNALGRKFKTGEPSANPSGRPPCPPEYAAAMDVLEPLGYQAMQDILTDPGHKDRGDISKYVTNRKHGKPVERKEVTGAGGAPLLSPTVTNALDVLRRLVGGEKPPGEA